MRPTTLVAACLIGIAASSTFAQSTAFTFQGELKSNGTLANGLHDVRFKLFDSASAGTQVGGTVCANNVQVDNGKFTATIDFGQQFASTGARHLEIEVRQDTGLDCTNTSGYVTLSPRQTITPAPKAAAANTAFSLSAPDGSPVSALLVDNSGQIGVGTSTPRAKLHVAAGDILSGPTGEEWIFHTRSSFAGDFLHITDSDAGVYQFQRGLVIHQNGRVGIGLTNPSATLDVNGNIKMAPQTRWVSIHGSAFTAPRANSPFSSAEANYERSSGLSGQTDSADDRFIAPVQLPQDAVITEVVAYYYNPYSNVSLLVDLERVPMGTGSVETMASLNSGAGGTSTAWTSMITSNITSATVDNRLYAYVVSARLLGSSSTLFRQHVRAVRITYTVTNPAP